MAELTRSATAQKMGLKNVPTSEHRANLEMTVAMLADPMREAWAIRCAHERWGSPALNVTSGYRGFRLNKAVGGAATSAHCVGFALDLVPANGRLAEFKEFCREYLKGRAFDQLISEDEDERARRAGYTSATKTSRAVSDGRCSPRRPDRRDTQK